MSDGVFAWYATRYSATTASVCACTMRYQDKLGNLDNIQPLLAETTANEDLKSSASHFLPAAISVAPEHVRRLTTSTFTRHFHLHYLTLDKHVCPVHHSSHFPLPILDYVPPNHLNQQTPCATSSCNPSPVGTRNQSAPRHAPTRLTPPSSSSLTPPQRALWAPHSVVRIPQLLPSRQQQQQQQQHRRVVWATVT